MGDNRRWGRSGGGDQEEGTQWRGRPGGGNAVAGENRRGRSRGNGGAVGDRHVELCPFDAPDPDLTSTRALRAWRAVPAPQQRWGVMSHAVPLADAHRAGGGVHRSRHPAAHVPRRARGACRGPVLEPRSLDGGGARGRGWMGRPLGWPPPHYSHRCHLKYYRHPISDDWGRSLASSVPAARGEGGGSATFSRRVGTKDGGRGGCFIYVITR